MTAVWRFYQNELGKWKWQQVSMDRAVLDESPHAFHDFDACVANAMECGYCFQPAQPCTATARFATMTNF